LSYTSSLFPATMPSTNSAAHQRLVLYTRLPLERFTAYAVKPDIGSESRFLPAFDAPVRGFRRNIAIPFDTEKLEWLGYPTVKKFLDRPMFIRFDRIHERNRHTDIHTHRHRMTA